MISSTTCPLFCLPGLIILWFIGSTLFAIVPVLHRMQSDRLSLEQCGHFALFLQESLSIFYLPDFIPFFLLEPVSAHFILPMC